MIQRGRQVGTIADHQLRAALGGTAKCLRRRVGSLLLRHKRLRSEVEVLAEVLNPAPDSGAGSRFNSVRTGRQSNQGSIPVQRGFHLGGSEGIDAVIHHGRVVGRDGG